MAFIATLNPNKQIHDNYYKNLIFGPDKKGTTGLANILTY